MVGSCRSDTIDKTPAMRGGFLLAGLPLRGGWLMYT